MDVIFFVPRENGGVSESLAPVTEVAAHHEQSSLVLHVLFEALGIQRNLFFGELSDHQRNNLYVFVRVHSAPENVSDVGEVHLETVLVLFVFLIDFLVVDPIGLRALLEIQKLVNRFPTHLEVPKRRLPLIAACGHDKVQANLVTRPQQNNPIVVIWIPDALVCVCCVGPAPPESSMWRNETFEFVLILVLYALDI